jgi:hypothetical protein
MGAEAAFCDFQIEVGQSGPDFIHTDTYQYQSLGDLIGEIVLQIPENTS